MGKTILKSILILIVVAVMVSFVREAQLKDQRLELKSIEIKDTSAELKILKEKYNGLNTELDKAQGDKDKVKQLEQERQKLLDDNKELQKQLQAKKAQRAKLAQNGSGVAHASSGSCSEWMTQAGVSDIVNAYELIRRESGCNPNAVNRSSGACGIPQALPCSKLGTTDPVKQIIWMQNYVMSRYGSWSNAVAWHNSHNWY
jgi:resuscitation-promoting factor RpfB